MQTTPKKENALAGTRALGATTPDNFTADDRLPAGEMVSGKGRFHTNEADPDKPEKRLTEYLAIGLGGIRKLVDHPQDVKKDVAQWLIPSNLPRRCKIEQEARGEYWMLWADLDGNAPLDQVERLIEHAAGNADFELYSSKSATAERQKCRALIPLRSPLKFHEWAIFQSILNDKFKAGGFPPDRASEGASQLLYLPNRGAFYQTRSKRNGQLFNPHGAWAAEMAAKRKAIADQTAAMESAKQAAAARREALQFSGGTDGAMTAFNRSYSVADVLLMAGYAQRGNCFRHPASESGNYSASVKNGRVHSLSPNDPLHSDKGARDAFDAFQVLFCGDDRNRALKLAGDDWLQVGGESWNKVQRREWAKAQQGPVVDFSAMLGQTTRAADGEAAGGDPDPAAMRYRLLTAEDLALLPPLKWIVRGVLPATGIGAMFGASGSGKSFLALDMLATVASGREWFGNRTKAAPVLYVALEGEAGIAQRVKAYERRKGPIPTGMRFMLQPLDIRNGKDQADLIAALRAADWPGDGVLCLDTLNRAAPGMDENDSKDMSDVIGAAKAIQAAIGGMVLVVHHTGKDSTRGMRGHSSLIAALDAAIEVNRTDERREWKIAKAKDGKDGEAHPFRLEVAMIGEDEDGEPVTSCVVLQDQDVGKGLTEDMRKAAERARDETDKAALLVLIEGFEKRGDPVPTAARGGSYSAFGHMHLEREFPKGVKNSAQLTVLLRDMEDAGKIFRSMTTTKGRREKQVFTCTPPAQECAHLPEGDPVSEDGEGQD